MQRVAIERQAAARGVSIATWYEEKASGRKLARPVLDAVRTAARRGEIGALFVYRVDRLTRSGIRDTLQIVAELRAHGVALHTVADGFDVEGPGGELVLAVLGWAAEMERTVIGERIKSARARVEGTGGRWGRPEKLDAGMKRRACQLQKEGKTLREIAQSLKVSRATVHRALSQKPTLADPPQIAAKMGSEVVRSKRVLSERNPGGTMSDEPIMLENPCPRCLDREAVFSYEWPGQPTSTCCTRCHDELVAHAGKIGLKLVFSGLDGSAPVSDTEPPPPPILPPRVTKTVFGAEPVPGVWTPAPDETAAENGSDVESTPAPSSSAYTGTVEPVSDDDEIPFGGDT